MFLEVNSLQHQTYKLQMTQLITNKLNMLLLIKKYCQDKIFCSQPVDSFNNFQLMFHYMYMSRGAYLGGVDSGWLATIPPPPTNFGEAKKKLKFCIVTISIQQFSIQLNLKRFWAGAVCNPKKWGENM